MVAFTRATPAIHIYYMAWNRHIHQTFNTTGTNWQDQDLTDTTGWHPGAIVDEWMARIQYRLIFQYLYYVSQVTGHVHQFLYNNSNWADEDLTALTDSSSVAEESTASSALVVPEEKKSARLSSREQRSHFAAVVDQQLEVEQVRLNEESKRAAA